MLLAAGAKVENLKDIKWHSIEDGEPGPGTGRWVALFILEPEGYVPPVTDPDFIKTKTEYIENERKQRKLF